ncbi:unnamed protein product [Aphis gossypii]|uniref:Uncharacterized protein n=1 Tax=Aphis gossypii TaxID=80765 RepID=A0A9P0JH60_APHGO|nr:unnamed protein product [Aphis gossypii]
MIKAKLLSQNWIKKTCIHQKMVTMTRDVCVNIDVLWHSRLDALSVTRLLLVVALHIKTNLGTGNASHVAIAAHRWLDSVSRPETKNHTVEIVSESCLPKDVLHV